MKQPHNLEDALDVLQSRGWADGEPETVSAPVSIVFSVRVKGELADWIAVEADRRHVSPSEIIREAITAARATGTDDEQITVTRSELHRLIDRLPAA